MLYSDTERVFLPENEANPRAILHITRSHARVTMLCLVSFEVSVAITEIEADEINSEFFYAISEIDGKTSFRYTLCDKVSKSKDGLTRHTNSKHSKASSASDVPVVCKENVDFFIEAKKYKTTILDYVGAASSTEASSNAFLPIYKTGTIYRKKNQDNHLETFHSLMLRSGELLSTARTTKDS